ncbi:hypothetical protein D3C72_1015260 [compost metagenome]
MAGLQHIGQHQTQHQRHQGGCDKPQHGLQEHPPHRCGIAHVCNADHQGREHQRADQHLDEPQEHIGDDGDVARNILGGALVGELNEDQVTDQDTQHHCAQDQERDRDAFFARCRSHGQNPFLLLIVFNA